MSLKFLTNITPFENNDQLKWSLFLDDVTNQLVVFDDNTNSEIARIPSGGGGAFELIATITKNDINALAGTEGGFVSSVPFNNRIPLSMYIKTKEVFDVDLWWLNGSYINSDLNKIFFQFNTTSVQIPPLNGVSVNNMPNTMDVNSPSTDTINFLCTSRNEGKPNNFIGGNTTGIVQVFALWQPMI